MATPGKVVILTGASRGIGLASAHYLLRQKCRLVVVARSRAPLEQLQREYPGQVQAVAGDLADLSLGQRSVDVAKETWGRIDSLLINHGVLDPIKRLSEFEPEEWRTAFDINVLSALALIKPALPDLRAAKGTIIFTSSGAAAGAYSAWGAYGAGKAVLNHVAMTLAVEEPDITTVSIRPGTVDTEMQRQLREVHLDSLDPQDQDKFGNLKKRGGLLKPEQPGHVIAKLALDAPKELSGRFLPWNDKDLSNFQE